MQRQPLDGNNTTSENSSHDVYFSLTMFLSLREEVTAVQPVRKGATRRQTTARLLLKPRTGRDESGTSRRPVPPTQNPGPINRDRYPPRAFTNPGKVLYYNSRSMAKDNFRKAISPQSQG